MLFFCIFLPWLLQWCHLPSPQHIKPIEPWDIRRRDGNNGDGNEASNCKTISEGVRTKRSKGLGKRSKDCHTIPNQMFRKIKTQTWIMKQIVWRIEAWTNGHHPYWTLTISNRPLERTSLPWRDMERPLSSWHSYQSNEIEQERYVKSTRKYPEKYVKHKL